jgi:hypothetical protein
MNARQPTPAPGPDLLARYLNAYLQARQMRDTERPWGLGDDELDELWSRLTQACSGGDSERLNQIVATELTDADRAHIVETIVPLVFALPLRAYPAELRATPTGPRLVLSLSHTANGTGGRGDPQHPDSELEERPASASCAAPPSEKSQKKKARPKDCVETLGYLPSALTSSVASYLRKVLRWSNEQHCCVVTISSGGRRRRVRVTELARGRGIKIRFMERLKSPLDE